jgi:hypothetical protein
MTASGSNRQTLHFEKGQCYVGTDTSRPVDMSRPEFAGLKDVISERGTQIKDGDYAWDASSRELIPASGGRL